MDTKEGKATLRRVLVMAACAVSIIVIGAAGASASPRTAAPVAQQPSPKVTSELRGEFRMNPGGKVRYLVVLTEQADVRNNIRDWNARGRFVYEALRKTANDTQPPVAALLNSRQAAGHINSFKSYYIINAFGVVGDLASAEAVASLPQVAKVASFPVATLDRPVKRAAAPDAPNAIEWNVSLVRAPQAWALGYNGAGITVGSLDTGARHTHNAIVGKYRGNLGGGSFDHNYNWWDPVFGQPAPHDNNGHGTHTIGTILGDDGAGNQIGVAPGANWISSNGIADGTTDPDIIEAGQWMIAPWDLNGQNADPSKRPHVVSNSWGFGVNAPGCPLDEFFHDIVNAWVAAGIFPSFSAGNGFPQGNRVPAAFPETFETGALTRQQVKASYSAAGPSCYDLGQHPQVMAGGGDFGPGLLSDLVRSSYNSGDNAYEFLAGTSMAQPATAGAVAILKQANPNLTIEETWYILTSTAFMSTSWGTAPNELYGWGLIQIDQAVLRALEMAGTATPTVTGTPPTNTPTFTPTQTRTATPTVPTATATNTPACVATYNSSDVPKPILDLITITSTLTVQNGPTIAGIEVINLGFEHTYAEDMDVFLVSPAGTRVELFTDICGGGDFTQANTRFTLTERAGITIGEVCPPQQATYKPEGSLSPLLGQTSSGTWTLEITDDVLQDTGTLHSWGLRISGNAPCATPSNTPVSGNVLVGHVNWQGRGTQPNALQQLPVTLTLKSLLGETNYLAQTTDASGFFTVSVGTLPAGRYNWRVKGPKFLANAGSVTLLGAPSTQQEMGLMRAGDCNNDNVVNAVDFNIVRASFGLSSGEPGYDDRADFTGDGVVSAVDFNLLRGSFGTGGAPPVGPERR